MMNNNNHEISAMTMPERSTTEQTFDEKRLERQRKNRLKRHIKIRAARIKRKLQMENRFHEAMSEMRTTSDRYRKSYLNWILQQMFTLFDYESGLRAINDKTAYESWLAENHLRQSS